MTWSCLAPAGPELCPPRSGAATDLAGRPTSPAPLRPGNPGNQSKNHGTGGRPPAARHPARARTICRQVPAEAAAPASWPDLFKAGACNSAASKVVLREETWKEWPSPAESDAEISRNLDGFDDVSWTRVWQLAGPFIQAVGFGAPAPRTAPAFVTYTLAFNQLGPGDLIALQALTEICLRASPAVPAYRELLDE